MGRAGQHGLVLKGLIFLPHPLTPAQLGACRKGPSGSRESQCPAAPLRTNPVQLTASDLLLGGGELMAG